jgi:hypothetical protein
MTRGLEFSVMLPPKLVVTYRRHVIEFLNQIYRRRNTPDALPCVACEHRFVEAPPVVFVFAQPFGVPEDNDIVHIFGVCPGCADKTNDELTDRAAELMGFDPRDLFPIGEMGNA